MKRIFTLLIISIFFSLQSFSQGHVNYNSSKWFIGLNMGGTYSSNTEVEVNGLYRGGLGFTFGKSFGMEKGNIFSWDFRLRYLFASYRGLSTSQFALDSTNTNVLNLGSELQQYQESYGYYVPNFQSWVNDWSLELQLNTNRLREKTGWNLFVFGGIGLTNYKTSTDLYDNDVSFLIKDENQLNEKGQPYNDYETKVVNNTDWMPHFGAGISRQLSPNVSFEVLGRMSWTRNNDFDAMPYNFDGSASKNDRYHYASASFKFYLGRGHTNTQIQNNNTVNNQNTNTNNVVNNTPRKPIVDFTNPSFSPYTTSDFNFNIQANIYYVVGSSNVTFKQNGVLNPNFQYDPNTDNFSANVILQPGQNIFELTGTNNAGSDYETTIIIYNKPNVVVKNPPIVTIINPSVSGTVVSNNVFGFSSSVLNVAGKQNIKVVFNGSILTNFDYNTISKHLTTTLNLVEGTNTVTVTGTNNDGTDSKTTKIIYRKPQAPQPPKVTITSPSANPFITASNSTTVLATVLNVNAKANIQVKLNGTITNNFSYNTTTKQVQFGISNLLIGVNVVSVKGTNSVGSDIASTTIIYRKPQTPKPPIVTFITPPTSPTTVYTGNYNLVARVLYVSSKNDITVQINGIPTSNFSYTASSQIVNLGLVLNQGSNVVTITGTNNDGSDVESTTLVYKRPVVQAPPVVTISYPSTDNQAFNTPNITVMGTVLNVTGSSNIQVKFNGATTTNFTFNTSTKVITIPVVLAEGNNTVQITGTNSAGSDSKIRKIIYKIPAVPTPPTVAFTNPPSSPFNVTNASFTAVATTSNISSKQQIVLKQNGVVINANQYAFSNSTLTFSTNLEVGNNIFEVTVSNNYGSDAALVIVNLEEPEPCTAPTVGYVSPQPNSTVTQENVTIDAQINNFIAGTHIELIHNGVEVGPMNFNSNTSIASKSVTMIEGSNSFQVHTGNECGENQSTFVIVYKKANVPCVNPEITTISPTSTTLTTEDSEFNIQMGVTGVGNAASITVKNNGTAIPFNFAAVNHLLQINAIPLVEGLNNIEITATNECGTESFSYQIRRIVCNPPVITLNSSTAVTTNNYSLTGEVTNIENAEDVTVSLNGNNINSTYNTETGQLSANMALQEGENSIFVTANGCESVMKNLEVIYTKPCNPATISVSSESTSSTTNYQLVAYMTNVSQSQVSVTVNGAETQFGFVEFGPNNGNLGAEINLIDGTNTIVITVEGCETVVETFTVDYEAPCDVPVVSLTSSTSTTVSSYNLVGTVGNVSVASGVTVTLNGAAVSSTYNPENGNLTASLSLVEGTNTIVVTANGCELITKTLTVDYTIPCNSPVITVSSSNASTSITYSLSAAITNIEDAANVTVSLNGTPVSSSFNTSTGVLTANLTLIEGDNSIFITANGCESTSKMIEVAYTPPCFAPTLMSGLKSNTLDVLDEYYILTLTTTNITSSSQISVINNGNAIPFTFNQNTISINVSLEIDELNSIIVTVTNSCGTDSQGISITRYDPTPKPNTTTPCLTPAVGVSSANVVDDASYSFAATITNFTDSMVVSLSHNGGTIPSNFNANTGVVTASLNLTNGNNVVVVNVNACEDISYTHQITYTPPCNAPIISLTSANSATANPYILAGTVTNVSSASNVLVKLNGANVSSTYNPSNGSLSANLNLTEGNNTILITANGCDVATQTLQVDYTAPCVSPVISLSSTTTATDANYTLTATVSNVDSPTEVSVKLNGATKNSNYNTTTDVLTSIFTLNEGANTILITANGCDQITQTIEVTYNPPCNAPVVSAVSVTQSIASGLTSGNSVSYSLSASVSNATGVTVTLNGATINLNYNSNTGLLSGSFPVIEGENSIIISANGCETTTVTETFTHETECDEPEISITSATNVTDNVYALIGTISNIDNASNVTVTVNGTAVTSTYNPTTGVLGATITLVEGQNTILISANGCENKVEDMIVMLASQDDGDDGDDGDDDEVTGPCGPRFNPGNSSWQFCLVTPSGTFTRDDLANNSNFSYSGTANSIYFKPIAGGGNATVSGNPYTLQNGQYYLFTGNITVDVSSSHPGSMGHWEVCLSSNTAPQFGSGNNRPTSPCEEDDKTQEVISKPIINPVNPSSISKTVTTSTLLFKANLVGVANKSNITLTLNGIRYTSFTYSTNTKQLSAVLRLRNGNNTIILTTENEGGTTVKRYTVNYKPKSTTTTTKPNNTNTKPNNTTTKPNNTSTGGKTTGGKTTGGKTTGSKTTGGKTTGSKTTSGKTTGNKTTGSKTTTTGTKKTTTTGGGRH